MSLGAAREQFRSSGIPEFRNGLVCLWAAASLAGCYTWHPVSLANPSRGARLDVVLSPVGTAALADSLGAGTVEVEGDVLQADAAGLRLAVRQVIDTRGTTHGWSGEPVLIAPVYVSEVSQRRLAVGGTMLVGGIALGGMYAVYTLLGGPGILSGNGGSAGSGGH